ncbi:amidohydrolase family protein [Marinitenerispora sediminis]|uniref:2-pyrone-4,6-dicarboxylate hydrolase n=1 Tax=Marinitenerispora sediminis TaxID=1931232 RepID=A0A368T7P0_9ACTN|nr:amidohydrolase family protein [Marinitenerispora sediminis]RCV52012.1 2-pyrone-4,6-dicarboxylate hydrolase [Marinitenerispora sediminis]RCV56923.1 2-pyrone-4,6-dicarboxylate hydrolase [Marinitenerispora sediminis]RCV60059.1 2-pyrone-4,6-dicarboxylate hydrolase [Marinitenerispora sediminis]
MFDAHLHIIGPRNPGADAGGRPAPFTVDEYLSRVAPLGVAGGAVVAGPDGGREPGPLLDALRRLGPSFVGVAELHPDTADSELRDLHAGGVRALRLDLRGGPGADLDAQVQLGMRAADLLGWPTELRVDAADLPRMAGRLTPLPRVSIDHLGLSASGLPALLDFVAGGARVKASGFGQGDLDVAAALRAVVEVNPAALMFGTALPAAGTTSPGADAERVRQALGVELAAPVFWRNALDFYGLSESPSAAGGRRSGSAVE